MSECIVLGARKVIHDASQTISKRQRPSAQARPPESVGRAVVGTRTEEVQSSWPLHRHAKERSRGPISGHSQAVQRGRWTIAKAHLHVPGLLGGNLSSCSSPQMEGVYPCDH